MRAKFKNIVTKYWIFFFLLLLFTYTSFDNVSLQELLKVTVSLSLWQLGVLILIFFSISFFNIVSRKYLISALGYSGTFKNLALIHFASIAAHYSTPAKIGFPLSVYLLNKKENLPYSVGTALVFLELLINMIVCGCFAVLGSFYYFKEHTYLIGKFLFFITICTLVAYVVLNKLILKNSSQNKVALFINNTLEAFILLPCKKLLLYIGIICSIQIWSSLGLVVLCNFFLAEISLFQAIAASKTSFFLGAITMVPLGLGVREGSMLIFLNHFGIKDVVGISIVSIQRILSTGLSFLLGALVGAFWGIKHIKFKK